MIFAYSEFYISASIRAQSIGRNNRSVPNLFTRHFGGVVWNYFRNLHTDLMRFLVFGLGAPAVFPLTKCAPSHAHTHTHTHSITPHRTQPQQITEPPRPGRPTKPTQPIPPKARNRRPRGIGISRRFPSALARRYKTIPRTARFKLSAKYDSCDGGLANYIIF